MTDIAAQSRMGLRISFASQVIKFSLQFILFALLARILAPGDFGLVAMAAPLIAFAQLFSDLGLTQATVMRKEISQVELSFTFWVTAAVSAALAIVVMAMAPLAMTYYREARVGPVVAVLGVAILCGGLSSQHVALLNRNLRFGALAAVDLGGFAIGGVVAVAAAIAGWTYWAIVLNQITASASSLAIAWSFSRWKPSRPGRMGGASGLLQFGGNVTGFNLVNFFARNLDNMLIGRNLGEVQLGLYDRAYKLLLLPLNQITGPIAKVAVPMLARSVADPADYRRRYMRMLEAVLLLTYPGVIVVGVASMPVIVTVLGPQWAGAAAVFRILAFGALFAPISNSTGWLLLTQDRTREMRNFGIFSSLAFVCSFFIGLPWGIVGVAAAYISVGTIQGPMIWWLTMRTGPVRFVDLLASLAPFALGAAAVGATTFIVCQYTAPKWFELGAMLAAAYIVFPLVMCILPRGRSAVAVLSNEVAESLSWLRLPSGRSALRLLRRRG